MEDYTDQLDKYGNIKRSFTLARSGKQALGNFMQCLLYCNGSISNNFQLGSWPTQQQKYVSTFFSLRFKSVDDLEKFHALGYQTSKMCYPFANSD